MKILIIAIYDDNFGDMLVRTCCTQLLKVALQNMHINDCSFDFMPITEIEDQRVVQADMIVIPGGAVFGRTPQAFAEPIARVAEIAEDGDIPVVLLSVGMLETEDNKACLRELLRKNCVRAFSVREKHEAFRSCAPEHGCAIRPVCDPATWAGSVYAQDIRRTAHPPVVGINVVRGGLFGSYGYDWKLADEEAYLYALSRRLEQMGVDYRFFTNGQTIDDNALFHFAEQYAIPREKLLCPDTSRELVGLIADFDVVAAIRMHASILSYALGVPSVNLVWNTKVSDFYATIGHPDRAVALDDEAAKTTAERIGELLKTGPGSPDPALLMTLYDFLLDTLSDAAQIPAAERYDYAQVSAALRAMRVSQDEDRTDMRVKLRRGGVRYLGLFTSDLARKAEMRELKTANKTLKQSCQALSDRLKKNAEKLKKTEKALKSAEKQRASMQRELDYLNSRLVVRVYRKLAGAFAKLRKRTKRADS